MARPKLDHINDAKKQAQLKQNLSRMEEQLGCSLHNFLSKKEKRGNNSFAANLKKYHEPAYHAAACLPPPSTLDAHLKHPDGPPPKTLDCIAEFCSRAFAFDTPISKTDLLTRELAPFPPLRKTGQWQRYLGLYRCFYFNPNFPDEPDAPPHLHGGLLKLWEEEGRLHGLFVTGIRRDEYFRDLEAMLEHCPKEKLYDTVKTYSDSYPDHEMRLVSYQGPVKTEIHGCFLMQLPRHKHTNTALILLRRRDDSVQQDYSGGIAAVTLCRRSKLSSLAMVIVREKLSLTTDKDFLTRYLRKTENGPKGLTVSVDLDEIWNSALMEQLRSKS